MTRSGGFVMVAVYSARVVGRSAVLIAAIPLAATSADSLFSSAAIVAASA